MSDFAPSVQTLFSSYSGFELEAGCDEAGRGCLAGPVVAAAVILDDGRAPGLVTDSKKMNAVKRAEAAQWIKEHALAWAIGIMSPEEIDKYNILWASVKAMNAALKKLRPVPEFILVDGNKFKSELPSIPHRCIVKGDSLIPAISAASVLAKTARDSIMEKLHRDYPEYDWKTNKGYPTLAHRNAVHRLGRTPHHRKSFAIRTPETPTIFD